MSDRPGPVTAEGTGSVGWVPTLTPTGRALTADGVAVAYYDLGGSGPVLLLAHATGFCGAVLAPLAERLTDRYRCIAFDERGHGLSERPPGEDFGWYGFAADIAGVIDHLDLDRPFGFGHSCGAAALLLTEQSRPGAFSALYCYEPIIYPDDRPLAPTLESNPLAAGAQRRREVFGSPEEALANFSSKAPFDRLHPEVLAAYVDNGFGPGDGGVRLRCRREDEALVYAHGLAHDAFAHLDEVRCPVTLACGAESDAVGPDFLALLDRRLGRSEMEVFPGLGHFGPMEDPDELARAVASAMEHRSDTPAA
jgi:pimeloyl-ACP methyl ester carboxylesterase